MYFCKGYDHGEKVDLSKGYWNRKRKMWVTTHFFRDNQATIILKKRLNRKNVWPAISFQILPQLSLKTTSPC